jgi:outer membrane PBP1 activator LpoA protein
MIQQLPARPARVSPKNNMGHDFPKYQKRLRISAALLICACLYGCSSSPEKPGPAAEVPVYQPIVTAGPAQLPPSQFNSQFMAAEQQLLEFDWMAATYTLNAIVPEQTSATDQQYLNYLRARIHYLKGDLVRAKALLQALSLSPTNPAIGNKADNFHRHLLSVAGEALQSARLTDQMLQREALNEEARGALQRSIWRDLQRLPAEQLRDALDHSSDPRWRGWLSLSLICAQAENEAQLRADLSNWRIEHPTHPGANTLPGGLDYIMEPPSTNLKVALMLPLSGRLAPAAKAVRDGYLSSFYRAKLAGMPAQEVQVVDLNRYDSAIAAYDEVVAAGANLVIGPLKKDDVARLGNHPDRRVPVIALNRTDQLLPGGTTALLQLALAPEDEAAQIAQRAFGDGARRAVVIRPAGSWGAKMEQALLGRWTQLGGQLAAVASYSSREDYSSSMASAMNLPDSQRRASDVRSMLATNIEFTARRRQDLDVIFLLSRNSTEARSLKPLLAYHYAADLPVYATSAIYRGVADARDRDLNGVQLVEIPWLLERSPDLRGALATGQSGSNNYARLNALGADAYLIQSRLAQMHAGPDIQIRGNTGLLSLDPQLRIKRELQSATFDGGALRAQ